MGGVGSLKVKKLGYFKEINGIKGILYTFIWDGMGWSAKI